MDIENTKSHLYHNILQRIAPNKNSSTSLTKSKQSKSQTGGGQSTANRAMPSDVNSAVKKQAEDEWTEFPHIETMPAKVDDRKLHACHQEFMSC